MKKIHHWRRILILSLLCFTVFAPLLFVSTRLKNFSLIVQSDFLEDLSAFKYRTDTVRLEAIEQEAGQNLKEPNFIVFEQTELGSVVTNSSSDDYMHSESTEDTSHESKKSESAEHTTITLQRTNHERKGEISPIQKETVPSKSDVEGQQSNKTVSRLFRNVKTQMQRASDEKVKEMKDQLIRAKAYLSFVPPGSTSHLEKELRLRIKELERSMGEAATDRDLPRSAQQKTRAMEVTLVKASRVFPDCSAMATKLRAMNYNAEEQVRAQKNQTAFLINLAARTTPKSFHCLSMRLTSEYFALPPVERQFPNQRRVHDPNLHHYVVFSDNILACAVVVNSTVSSAKDTEKIVFHVMTDSLNLPAISMWFLLNPPSKATIHIQSIDNLGWLSAKYNSTLKQNSYDPRYSSALNHLRFYLPDIFPLLNKIVFFDHDVVVQRDLMGLWSINMKGKVNGAVETCQEGETSFREMDMLINFSEPFVTKKFDPNACTWAFGMNLFDLEEWRRQNLTALYHKYLQMGYRRPLWKAGSLPLGWATFYNQTVGLDKRWHRLGLGYESGIAVDEIKQAAVLHYDGVMKPWLDIGINNYKRFWSRHLNYDHPYLQQCNVQE